MKHRNAEGHVRGMADCLGIFWTLYAILAQLMSSIYCEYYTRCSDKKVVGKVEYVNFIRPFVCAIVRGAFGPCRAHDIWDGF